METEFLDKAYNLKGNEATRTLYDAWSANYEAEVAWHGYASPGRVARALGQLSPNVTSLILDTARLIVQEFGDHPPAIYMKYCMYPVERN